MAYQEPIPVDISKIRIKLLFRLTKRQIICFTAAGLIGVPVYFATKEVIGTDLATFLMIAVMMPFFFLAIYEKDGVPAEVLLWYYIRYKYLRPGIRPYQSENIYQKLEQRRQLMKEVRYLEAKADGTNRKGKK